MPTLFCAPLHCGADRATQLTPLGLLLALLSLAVAVWAGYCIAIAGDVLPAPHGWLALVPRWRKPEDAAPYMLTACLVLAVVGTGAERIGKGCEVATRGFIRCRRIGGIGWLDVGDYRLAACKRSAADPQPAPQLGQGDVALLVHTAERKPSRKGKAGSAKPDRRTGTRKPSRKGKADPITTQAEQV